MTATEKVNAVKRVNGHGDEIIQVFDNVTGKRVFTTLTATPDDEIRENALFEIDYNDKELRMQIAELVISMK